MSNLIQKTKAGLFLMLFVFSSHLWAVESKEVPQGITPEMILHYINEYRVQHHLTPLKMNPVISKEALKHSQEMASKRVPFGHDHFNQRIKTIYGNFQDCRGGAENVAYYKTNAKKLVEAWIASSGHRQNIRGHYNLTGIGIAYSKKGWAYYTQIFLNTKDPKYT